MALDRGHRLFSGEEIARSAGVGPVLVTTPLTATTITMSANYVALLVKPAGTIAALTILLPPINAMGDGGLVSISCTQTVTSLVIQDSNANAVETSAGVVSTANYYRVVAGVWQRWD
jgi:hypothetical protein